MLEKRKLERFSLNIPAKIEILPHRPEAKRTFLRIYTSNICSGGAYFATNNPLQTGTAVKIDLILDPLFAKYQMKSWALVKVQGTVMRSETSGMAVQFDPQYRIISKTKA